MKRMKKWMAWILLVALCFTMCDVSAFAGSSTAVQAASTETMEAAEGTTEETAEEATTEAEVSAEDLTAEEKEYETKESSDDQITSSDGSTTTTISKATYDDVEDTLEDDEVVFEEDEAAVEEISAEADEDWETLPDTLVELEEDDGDETDADSIIASVQAVKMTTSEKNNYAALPAGMAGTLRISYSGLPSGAKIGYEGNSKYCTLKHTTANYSYTDLRITAKSKVGGTSYIKVWVTNRYNVTLKTVKIKLTVIYMTAPTTSASIEVGKSTTFKLYSYGEPTVVSAEKDSGSFKASMTASGSVVRVKVTGVQSGSGTITVKQYLSDYNYSWCQNTVTLKIKVTAGKVTLKASPSSVSVTAGSKATVRIRVYSGYENLTIDGYLSKDICSASWGSSGAGYIDVNITGTKAGTAKLVVYVFEPGKSQKLATLSVTVKVTKTWSNLSGLSFSFGNTADDFGYGSGYKIPLTAYYRTFGRNALAIRQYNSAGNWTGSCYGMSSTAGLFRKSTPKLTTFRSSASYNSDLSVGDQSGILGINLTRFIECMQIGWNAVSVSYECSDYWDQYQKIYSAVSSSSPGVIYICSNGKAHAVLAYRKARVSSTESRIYIYDPNHPLDSQWINLYRSTSGGAFTSWDYYDYGSYKKDGHISFVPYSAYYSEYQNFGDPDAFVTELAEASPASDTETSESLPEQEDYNYLTVNTRNFTLYRMDKDASADDLKETKIASYTEDAGLVLENGVSDIYEVLQISEEEEYVKLYVPTGKIYIVKSNESGGEQLEVAMANVKTSAEVTTSGLKASLSSWDGVDGNEIAAAQVEDAAEGTAYRVSLTTTQDDGSLKTYSMSGSVGSGETSGGLSLSGDSVSATGSGTVSGGVDAASGSYVIETSIAEDGWGGTMDPTGNVLVKEGASRTVTITPSKGCVIDEILVDGTAVALTESERQQSYVYTFENVTADHSIEASFAAGDISYPASFTGVRSQDKNSVDLSWSSVDGAEGYALYRKEKGESWPSEPFVEVGKDTQTYHAALTEAEASGGKTYVYAVAAYATVSGGKVYSFKSKKHVLFVGVFTSGSGTGDSGTSLENPGNGGVLSEFVVKGIRYRVLNDGSSVTVTGAVSRKIKKLNVPSEVTYENVTYRVESVADQAFKGYKKLKSVKISGVSRIGKKAFAKCKSLKKIVLKTKALAGKKSVGKNALKGISPKAKIIVPASCYKKYKKWLKGKGQSRKVKIVKK